MQQSSKYIILQTFLWSNLCLIQIQSKSCGHLTTHLIAIPWLTCHIPNLIRGLCISSLTDEYFLHYYYYYGWPSYRGLDGLSNTVDAAIRIDFTLCRGCTLYPHHGTHGLVLPFGWTNDVPTKPAWPVTLPSYDRQSYSLLESSPGWPRVTSWHLPASWPN